MDSEQIPGKQKYWFLIAFLLNLGFGTEFGTWDLGLKMLTQG